MAEREGYRFALPFACQKEQVSFWASLISPNPSFANAHLYGFSYLPHQPSKIPHLAVGYFTWRRERDSNPRRDSRPSNDLANRPLQPLGYLSSSESLTISRFVFRQKLRFWSKFLLSKLQTVAGAPWFVILFWLLFFLTFRNKEYSNR